MPKSNTRPTPPCDYAERACLPLVPGDADVVALAVKRILGTAPDTIPRQKRTTEMLSLPLENVPSWISHHAGEAWSSFSEFVAQGGVEYCRDSDDLDEVCDLFARVKENWLDRLESCFAGLEREADPDGFFRVWCMSMHRSYLEALFAAQLSSLSDSTRRHLLCQRAVSEIVPSFAQFFDSLRDFVGAGNFQSGKWGQGDEYRKGWSVNSREVAIL